MGHPHTDKEVKMNKLIITAFVFLMFATFTQAGVIGGYIIAKKQQGDQEIALMTLDDLKRMVGE